jgi:hypothetical protein
MKAQSESSINTTTWSRSVQLQPSTDGSAKAKTAKEAEAARPGSRRKWPQHRSLQSLGDVLPRSSPQKRAPPKWTTSLDESEFRSKLGQNPPTLARRSSPQIRAPPKASKSFDENEYISKHGHPSHHGKSQRSWPQPPILQSVGEDLPRSSHQKRAPPKPSKSLDENEFRRKLRPNPIPYLQSRIDEVKDNPGTALNGPTIVDTGPQPSQ